MTDDVNHITQAAPGDRSRRNLCGAELPGSVGDIKIQTPPGRPPGPCQWPRSGPTDWYGHLEASHDFGYLMQSCRRPPQMGDRIQEKRPKGRPKGRKMQKTERGVGAPRLPYAKLSAAPDLVRADDLGKAVGRSERPEMAERPIKGRKTAVFTLFNAQTPVPQGPEGRAAAS